MNKYSVQNRELAKITEMQVEANPRKMWRAKKYSHKFQKQQETNFKLKKEKIL